MLNERDKYTKLPVHDFYFKLSMIERTAGDTTSYYFFPEKDLGQRYFVIPNVIDEIKTINDKPFFPVAGGIAYEENITMDSANRYFREMDSSFMIFLDNYHGKMKG